VNNSSELESVIALATDWAEEHSQRILSQGFLLNESMVLIATRVGVVAPERIRIQIVDLIPSPDKQPLKAFCENLEFLGPETWGLTLGSSIYIRKDHADNRKSLAHELCHVFQYERFGSIRAFLAEYIPQFIQFGYKQMPLELEAVNAEKLAV